MTPINFTANYLKTTYLPRKANDNSYKPTEVSIVALDTKDKKDLNVLGQTSFEWEKVASGYSMDIYNDAIKYKPFPDVIQEHYLAITQQNEDYANLDGKKILGFAMFSEKDETFDEITWLQANPKTNNECSNNREFLGIGRKLVEYMEDISDKPIKVNADEKAVPFYKKLGFVATNPKVESMLYLLR